MQGSLECLLWVCFVELTKCCAVYVMFLLRPQLSQNLYLFNFIRKIWILKVTGPWSRTFHCHPYIIHSQSRTFKLSISYLVGAIWKTELNIERRSLFYTSWNQPISVNQIGKNKLHITHYRKIYSCQAQPKLCLALIWISPPLTHPMKVIKLDN